MSDRTMRADLPHEIVEGNCGPRGIKRRNRVHTQVVAERICFPRMEYGRALFVSHHFT